MTPENPEQVDLVISAEKHAEMQEKLNAVLSEQLDKEPREIQRLETIIPPGNQGNLEIIKERAAKLRQEQRQQLTKVVTPIVNEWLEDCGISVAEPKIDSLIEKLINI